MDSDDSYLDEYDYYNEDEDEEEDDVCRLPPAFLLPQNYTLPQMRYITPEEADRNARELLQEEEREKEKADKKRLRKKRQKDRRRQKLQEAQNEKIQSEEKTETPDNNNGEQKVEADDEDRPRPDSNQSTSDDDLDLRSTFVRQAQKKVETKVERRGKEATRATERTPKPERVTDGAQERARTQPHAAPQPQSNINILDRFKIQESLDLANIGNNMAGRGRFEEALHYYTEAIKINPSEFRFLGNRSYVYERLGQHEEAMRDAESALQIQPHFLKGHFRKGKALKGLKRYTEAVAVFQQVLSCDPNHMEAAAEIVQCQQNIQEAMTSTRVKILSSAPLSPPATPPIGLSGQNSKVFVPRNIYNTKSDPNKGSAPKKEAGVTPHSKFYPIWVGNVTNKITENTLRAKFQPFGLIHSVRILYDRTCAFINFTSKDSAEAAFASLQGANVEGTTLVLQLRNPEHSAGRAPGPLGVAGK